MAFIEELTDEREAELRAQYEQEHDVARLETVAGSVMVRTPTEQEHNRFQLQVTSNQVSQGMAAYAKKCVVYPDAERFTEVLKRYPALATSVSNAVAKMAGMEDLEPVKK